MERKIGVYLEGDPDGGPQGRRPGGSFVRTRPCTNAEVTFRAASGLLQSSGGGGGGWKWELPREWGPGGLVPGRGGGRKGEICGDRPQIPGREEEAYASSAGGNPGTPCPAAWMVPCEAAAGVRCQGPGSEAGSARGREQRGRREPRREGRRRGRSGRCSPAGP